MKTSNEQILDRFTKRQVHLAQYADGLSNEAGKLLKGTEDDAAKTLLWFGTKLEGKPLASKAAHELRKQLRVEVASIRNDAWSEIGSLMTGELKQLAIDEATFASKAIDDSLPIVLAMRTPNKRELNQLVTQTPFQGKTIDEHIDHMQVADTTIIGDRATLALEQNNSPSALVLSVMGTLAMLRRDGVIRRARDWVDATVQTGVTSTASQARSALNSSNDYLITQEYFRATLDAGTTPTCMANDGKVFKIGRGPHPPLHWRCRSIRSPYVDPNIAERGFDPSTEKMLVREYSKGAVSSRSSLPYGEKTKFDVWARKRRRQMIGQVPSEITYGEWLLDQSKEFQDEVLGIERAKLFRRGRLPISKFVNRQGRFLTLEQLRAKGYDVNVPGRI